MTGRSSVVERQKPVTNPCPLAGRWLTVITVNEEVAEFESRRPDCEKVNREMRSGRRGQVIHLEWQALYFTACFLSAIPCPNKERLL